MAGRRLRAGVLQRRSGRHLHRGGGLRGVHLQGAAAVPAVQEHHARRRRHGRPRLAARLRQIQPAAPPADHRLDAGLVRRVSGPDLLLPRPDRRHRPPVVRHPVQHRLQAGHASSGCSPCRSRPGPSGGWPGCAFPARPAWPWPPCRTSSAGSSPSTAAISPRPWPGSSASRSACRWPWCSWALVARGLEDGRHRALAAVLLAACGVCHILPLFFAIGGAVVLTLMRFDRRRLQWTLPGPGRRRALIAFWALPFYVRLPYATNMGYEKLTDYLGSLFPGGDTWLFILAGLGVVLALARRNRVGNVPHHHGGAVPRWCSGSPRRPGCGTPGCCRSGSSACTCWPGWRSWRPAPCWSSTCARPERRRGALIGVPVVTGVVAFGVGELPAAQPALRPRDRLGQVLVAGDQQLRTRLSSPPGSTGTTPATSRQARPARRSTSPWSPR